MKIYFAASISGGRKYESVYRRMVAHLKGRGHLVLTEHIAFPTVLDVEKAFTPEEIFSRDLQWLAEAEVVVAEVSNPSLGVGFEICRALELKKPVLCVYEKGIRLTKMITGNQDEQLTVKKYTTWPELESILNQYLNERI